MKSNSLLSPRVDELLARVVAPELREAAPVLGTEDVLITCAGFEDRALAFLSRAVEAGSRNFGAVGVEYRPEVPENRVREFLEKTAAAKAEASLVTYDRQRPEGFAEILNRVADTQRLLIDVSGMSRLLIVQLIAASVRRGLIGRLEVVYSEAEVYPPSEHDVRLALAENRDYVGVLNFVSSGVFGITVVPELSTVAMQGQPIRLVVFPSFNPTQLAAVCAETPAAVLAVVNGIPPRAENAWRHDAIRTLNGVQSLREREEFDASTFDYRQTLQLILELYAKHGASQKFIISPTGSKMQSVAVGLACGFLRDLQVVYPTPKFFPTPTNYTTGVRRVYRLQLDAFASVPISMPEVPLAAEPTEREAS